MANLTPYEEKIRSAVQEKLPIYAIYDEHKRWMCPHVIGYKGSKMHVLSYQYQGESSKGELALPVDPLNGPPDRWRCMEVSKLIDLEILPRGIWYTAQNHSKRQTCVDSVLAISTGFSSV
jgi:hypothetical protein